VKDLDEAHASHISSKVKDLYSREIERERERER